MDKTIPYFTVITFLLFVLRRVYIRHGIFCTWLPLLTTTLMRFIHTVAWNSPVDKVLSLLPSLRGVGYYWLSFHKKIRISLLSSIQKQLLGFLFHFIDSIDNNEVNGILWNKYSNIETSNILLEYSNIEITYWFVYFLVLSRTYFTDYWVELLCLLY